MNVFNAMSSTNSSLQEMPPRDSKTNFTILRFQTKCNTKEMFSSHPKIVPSSNGLMVLSILSIIYKILYKFWPHHRTCICYLFIGFQCHHGSLHVLFTYIFRGGKWKKQMNMVVPRIHLGYAQIWAFKPCIN